MNYSFCSKSIGLFSGDRVYLPGPRFTAMTVIDAIISQGCCRLRFADSCFGPTNRSFVAHRRGRAEIVGVKDTHVISRAISCSVILVIEQGAVRPANCTVTVITLTLVFFSPKLTRKCHLMIGNKGNS